MLLAEEIDKLGNKIEIYHSKLSYSPAYSFFLRQQADLIDSDHIFPCTFWEDEDSEIVWAELDGRIIGTTCFTTKYVDRLVFPLIYTHSTAVDKQYRRRGIHSILFKYFQHVAEKYKCQAVGISAEVTNVPRLTAAKKDGLIIFHSIFRRDINLENVINDDINIELDPIDKPAFECVKKEQEKFKRYLTELGHSESSAYSMTKFYENSGLMYTNDGEVILFYKTEIKTGNLYVYMASSYKYVDTLANYLGCQRITVKLSVADKTGAEQLKKHNFEHKFFALYKLITKKD
jgi:GNAT superfamily N-acetyltransferase